MGFDGVSCVVVHVVGCMAVICKPSMLVREMRCRGDGWCVWMAHVKYLVLWWGGGCVSMPGSSGRHSINSEDLSVSATTSFHVNS